MNSIELKKRLLEMSQMKDVNIKNFDSVTCEAIADIVVTHYITFSGYYEENAIASYEHWLETGDLLWDVVSENDWDYEENYPKDGNWMSFNGLSWDMFI